MTWCRYAGEGKEKENLLHTTEHNINYCVYSKNLLNFPFFIFIIYLDEASIDKLCSIKAGTSLHFHQKKKN
jgi:hypothetical protein